MVDKVGTNGNDNLVGTAADERFIPLDGVDTVDGGGGNDTLIVEYYRHLTSPVAHPPSTLLLDADGFSGTFYSRASDDSTTFSRIDQISALLSYADDAFIYTVKSAAAVSGRLAVVEAGLKWDTATLDLSAVDNLVFTTGAEGKVTTNAGVKLTGFEYLHVIAGGGVKSITTGLDADVVRVGTGSSTIFTADGDDFIYSGAGKDVIDGGLGQDGWTLDLASATAAQTFTFNGATGAASVAKGSSASHIEQVDVTLGSGADTVTLTSAFDSHVNTGGGADRITVTGGGRIDIDGGAGIDTLTVNFAGTSHFYETNLSASGTGAFGGYLSLYDGVNLQSIEKLTATLGDNDDIVTVDALPIAQGAQLTLDGGLGHNLLTLDFSATGKSSSTTVDASGTLKSGNAVFRNFESFHLTGSSSTDKLTGGAGSNYIDGGAGADVLTGGASDDILIGGDGKDTLYGRGGFDDLRGGLGDDTYYVDSYSLVTEYAGEGTDTLVSSVSNLLADNVERLTLTGGDDLTGFGNALDNILTGNAGSNTLYGDAGRDTLYGGDGVDYLHGEGGGDYLYGGAGMDFFFVDAVEPLADQIRDFDATDYLYLSAAGFGAITTDPDGAIAASNFVAGTKALTADQHLIYNAAVGGLYYDPDGAGGAAQSLIASFANKPALTLADIALI